MPNVADFSQSIEKLSARPGLTARVMMQLKSSSTLVLVALPTPFWEWLETHPAFFYIGNLVQDEQTLPPLENIPENSGSTDHHLPRYVKVGVSKSSRKKWTYENDLNLLFMLLNQKCSQQLNWIDATVKMGNQFSSDATR